MLGRKSHEDLRKRKPDYSSLWGDLNPDEVGRNKIMELKTGYSLDRLQRTRFETGY